MQSKFSISIFLFLLIVSSTGYEKCVYGSNDKSGFGIAYGKIAGNAVRQAALHQAVTSMNKEQRKRGEISDKNISDNNLKESFKLTKFSLLGILYPIEIKVGSLYESDFSTIDFGIAFSPAFPLISNRLFITPGAEYGLSVARQDLIESFMGENTTTAIVSYGRFFVGLELRLFSIISLAAEAGWSKYNAFNEWEITDPSTKNKPALEQVKLSVPDELLPYSQMEVGGYEFAIFLRLRG
jgi:hypothetical protein